MDKWTKEIAVEDIPEQYHELIRIIGLEPFLKLMNASGGTYLYVPKPDQILRKIRDEKIRAEFKGNNYRKLALKYGLTEITIRHITEEEKNKPLPGQLSMSDLLTGTQ